MIVADRSARLRPVAALVTVILAVACAQETIPPPAPFAAASITIRPSRVQIPLGQRIRVDGAVRDSAGRRLRNHAITWTIEPTSVATVAADGLVTGIAPGNAMLTATAADMSVESAITVGAVPPAAGDIVVDPGVLHQTMLGWDVVPNAGQWHCGDTFFAHELAARYMQPVLDTLVALGINRIRMPLRAGAENPHDGWSDFAAGSIDYAGFKSDWYKAINDNDDPLVIDPAGFHFSELDYHVERVAVPLRERLRARGEQLFFVLNYIQFQRSVPFQHRSEAEEYAEFILAAFRHMDRRWGFVPDAVEIINEPDYGAPWNSREIGNAIVATGNRLRAAGWYPAFIAPSAANMHTSLTLFDEMMDVPGVASYLSELSYHRYGGVGPNVLAQIGERAQLHGIGTAMLEHIGSGYEDLHADLAIGRNTSWEQYSSAGCDPGDPGGRHILIDTTDVLNPQIRIARRSQFLRLYFQWVRRGAIRVGATAADTTLSPLAFINPDGRHTVIVKATGAATFTVGGLPPGRYGMLYTTGPDDRTPQLSMVSLQDVVLPDGGRLTTQIPGRGIITIHAKD